MNAVDMTHRSLAQLLRICIIMAAVLLLMPSGAVAEADGLGQHPNRQFELIHDEVPGFGGAWVKGDALAGEEETLHIWLIEPDADAQQRVQALLIDLLGDRFDQESVVVHDDGLPWGQLQEWFIAVSESRLVSTVPVGHIGIREQINRIVVGVEDPERDGPAVREVLVELDVPQDAVVIEQGGAVVPAVGRSPFWAQQNFQLLLLLGVAGAAGASWWLIRRRSHEAVT